MLRNVVDSSGIICFPKTGGETPAFVEIQIPISKQEMLRLRSDGCHLVPQNGYVLEQN